MKWKLLMSIKNRETVEHAEVIRLEEEWQNTGEDSSPVFLFYSKSPVLTNQTSNRPINRSSIKPLTPIKIIPASTYSRFNVLLASTIKKPSPIVHRPFLLLQGISMPFQPQDVIHLQSMETLQGK